MKIIDKHKIKLKHNNKYIIFVTIDELEFKELEITKQSKST